MKKRIFSIVLVFLLLLTSPSLGHSGRTDAQGGHKDNKNKSGLGSYHYHCGGYPAHLHSGGICPYSSRFQKSVPAISSNVNKSSSSNVNAINNNSIKAQVPNFPVKLNGVNINTSTAEYPPIVYQDITYVPLTYDILTYLNVTYTWDNPYSIIINSKSTVPTSKPFTPSFQTGTSYWGKNATIQKVNKTITIDGDNFNSEYPVINSKNINYFPLTYEIITKLGLSSKWDSKTGLELNVTN
ncbi:hypothetical protein SAMN00017405_0526 [Desulfonispora thiosulfatigenes DSM 11270]|uniref:Copper amine oxidase N-terminal domain-containing protein n=1 Tax=Desulfonispora thiosulfatigenes DSM 11270 TaxID=656914 RepID=A0A1W1V6Y8_DESTI|nr:YHYH domain-containing protein [Desulfonispora thiosulfatigenes]SMB88791.1 hypothetical protein SAMN00017405_0526 [Desulfonispora thiosulfatigenes DSM 11270]